MDNKMSTILNFINTGMINDITPGMTIKQVKLLLGEPDNFALERDYQILKYCDLELTFNRVETALILNSMNIHNFEGEMKLPFTLKGWAPVETATINEFLEKVAEAGIDLVQDESHTIEGMQVGYRSDCGVVTIFNIEEPRFEGIFYRKDS